MTRSAGIFYIRYHGGAWFDTWKPPGRIVTELFRNAKRPLPAIALAVGVVLLLAAALTTCDGAGESGVLYRWVELGPSASVIARVIVENPECPMIRIDGVTSRMDVRADPEDDFPVLTCEKLIPDGTRSASVGGKGLNLPVDRPGRIIVIGDTGCRLSAAAAQACNDPSAWPFKQIADTAAALDPDLIIHVGDYLYREAPCPEGDAGCAGSPFGDNWGGWEADFFAPADTLLPAAPWVLLRGNHEMCSRGGEGWFTFLDPYPLPPECQEFTDPYVIDIGGVDLLVLDSSSAQDNSAPAGLVETYAGQIGALFESIGDDSWFLVHHPLWGIGEFDGSLFKINQTLQAATGNTLAPGINLVLGGHIHLFEILTFEGGRSPQMLVGNSGTTPDQAVTIPLSGEEIGGGVVDRGITEDEFGFVVMDRADGGWLLSLRGVSGAEILSCTLVANVINCD